MTNLSARNKIVRGANRAFYDKVTLNRVLDAGYICHLTYNYEGSPIIIPTGYVREDDTIYVHGSLKNRMLNHILDQVKTCVSVTHLEPFKIEDKVEKVRILELLTENILPGRWNEVRKPNEKELKATMVIGIKINEFSVKIREGGPVDEKNNYQLDIWAGELPIIHQYQQPIPDINMKQNLSIPKSVRNALKEQSSM